MPAGNDVSGCPRDFDATAKSRWKKIRNAQVAAGIWGPVDSLWLERLLWWDELGRTARRRISERPDGDRHTTSGSMGQLVQHPDLRTAELADRECRTIAATLLLTPASRAKAGLKIPRAGGLNKDQFGFKRSTSSTRGGGHREDLPRVQTAVLARCA